MRLLLTVTAQFNRVMCFDLNRIERLPVDEADNRPQKEIGADNESTCKYAGDQLARAGEGSDHRRTPERCRGIEASHIDAFSQDYARTEESDAGDDLGGDLRLAAVARYRCGEHNKAGGANRDERIGAESSHELPPLPLEADDGADDERRCEADRDVVGVHGSAAKEGEFDDPPEHQPAGHHEITAQNAQPNPGEWG